MNLLVSVVVIAMCVCFFPLVKSLSPMSVPSIFYSNVVHQSFVIVSEENRNTIRRRKKICLSSSLNALHLFLWLWQMNGIFRMWYGECVKAHNQSHTSELLRYYFIARTKHTEWATYNAHRTSRKISSQWIFQHVHSRQRRFNHPKMLMMQTCPWFLTLEREQLFFRSVFFWFFFFYRMRGRITSVFDIRSDWITHHRIEFGIYSFLVLSGKQ